MSIGNEEPYVLTRAGGPRTWAFGAARLLVIGLALGWLYGWAGPRLYPEQQRFGFGWGMAHGALMPMALPALLMGRDVDIYAGTNTGRAYKLGYITGINLCGLVVFGGAFWRPARRSNEIAGVVRDHRPGG
jgi:hypothetical protein